MKTESQFDIRTPKQPSIMVNFKKIKKGYDVKVCFHKDGHLLGKGYEFFFNSEKAPTTVDAEEYANLYLLFLK